MGEIDWNRYARLCSEATSPTVGRFAQSLRSAAVVATNQSIPVYTGAMKACLITALRQSTDILKRLARVYLAPEEKDRIRWKDVEEKMREVYFDRLGRIEGMQIAREYISTRIHNKPSDQEGIYRWVNSLRGREDEIARIVSRTGEEIAAFASQDVPEIIELARLGIRLRG